MTDACFLSPPAGADQHALEAHLENLRSMNIDDPLVRLAIDDTEIRLAEMTSK